MNIRILSVPVLALAFLFSACNGGSDSAAGVGSGANPHAALPDTSAQDPANPVVRAFATQVLLFNGVGVSTSDWQTTEQIVSDAGLSYQLVNSAQLDALSLDQMATFGMMIFPGGYGNQITDGLQAATTIRIRQAVRDRGVGFFGICAGAWVAVGPESATDNQAAYGFAVANGSFLDEYLPNGQEPEAAMVDVSFADGSSRWLVWWGGPITPNWPGGVVARYSTGAPAISQIYAGKGFVTVAGPHTEAPDGWRATAGNDPDGLDYDIATKLIKSTLNRTPLKAF
ncbi:MAG: hypothetical protein HY075_08800 [Deltaproteobacteria bacterium]|nr:hypothetical protein [Deltaproteobacteria bacterium]